MTAVLIYPNADVLTTSWVIYGGPSTFYGALSDNGNGSGARYNPLPTDSSSTGLETARLIVDYATYTIPAGAVVSDVTLQVTGLIYNTNPFPYGQYAFLLGYSTDGTNTKVPCQNTGGAGSVSLGPGSAYYNAAAFPNSQTKLDNFRVMHSVFIKFQNTAGGADIYESNIYLILELPPTVTVSAPTGNVATNYPTVTWTYSQVDSDAQAKYQVKIYSAAQYGAGGFDPNTSAATYDSGLQNGTATSFAIPSNIAGGTYRAYVQSTKVAAPSASLTSAWAFSGFTILTTPPNAPLITASWDATNARTLLSAQLYDNEMDAVEASFETTPLPTNYGWNSPTNGTTARSTAQALDGSASLAFTASAAGDIVSANLWNNALNSTISGKITKPGQQYTARVFVRSATVGRTCKLGFLFGGVIQNEVTVVSTTSGWTELVTTGTAPLTGTTGYYSGIRLTIVGAAGAGEVHYIDKCSFSPSNGSATVWNAGGLIPNQQVKFQRSIDGQATWQDVIPTNYDSLLGSLDPFNGYSPTSWTLVNSASLNSEATYGRVFDINDASAATSAYITGPSAACVGGETIRVTLNAKSISGASGIFVQLIYNDGLNTSQVVNQAITGAWASYTFPFVVPNGKTSYQVRIGYGDPSVVTTTGEFYVAIPQVRQIKNSNTDGSIPVFNPLLPSQNLPYVYDNGAPPGATVYYRAVALFSFTGAVQQSAYSAVVGPITATYTDWWLKDTVDANKNIVLRVIPTLTQSYPSQETAFQALGRAKPVVVSDVANGMKGSINCDTLSKTEYETLQVLLSSRRTFILQSPYGYNNFVKVLNNRDYNLIVGDFNTPYRTVKFDYVEVDI